MAQCPSEIKILSLFCTRHFPWVPFFITLNQYIMTKYVVVSGGVISGIGKGVIASSTGMLLKSLGLRVTAIKIDPYLNIDAGLMSPLDHGMFG